MPRFCFPEVLTLPWRFTLLLHQGPDALEALEKTPIVIITSSYSWCKSLLVWAHSCHLVPLPPLDWDWMRYITTLIATTPSPWCRKFLLIWVCLPSGTSLLKINDLLLFIITVLKVTRFIDTFKQQSQSLLWYTCPTKSSLGPTKSSPLREVPHLQA